jgi:hypothetical protein
MENKNFDKPLNNFCDLAALIVDENDVDLNTISFLKPSFSMIFIEEFREDLLKMFLSLYVKISKFFKKSAIEAKSSKNVPWVRAYDVLIDLLKKQVMLDRKYDEIADFIEELILKTKSFQQEEENVKQCNHEFFKLVEGTDLKKIIQVPKITEKI